ncbi:hypothetical protein RR46_10410 [Papilio xuthus]|uniref:Uncharacterized protein n=1 Tax=Papilio xuthus TaxID=66420 RepID=A0A194Q0I4_PAPXU|nr:hypothetical protein RR46_10410 [Papilio xuthus]
MQTYRFDFHGGWSEVCSLVIGHELVRESRAHGLNVLANGTAGQELSPSADISHIDRVLRRARGYIQQIIISTSIRDVIHQTSVSSDVIRPRRVILRCHQSAGPKTFPNKSD